MKNYKTLCISVIITEFIILLMTIASEISEGFKSVLTEFSGHHWISKGVIALIIFFIMNFMYRNIKSKDEDVWKYTWAVFWFTILFTLIIILFFVFEFFE